MPTTTTERPRAAQQLFAPLHGARLTRAPATGYSQLLAAYAGSLTQHTAAPRPRRAPEAQARPGSTTASTVLRAAAVTCALALALVVVGGPLVPGGVGRLWTVLLTGLTAGGLSCLAVQGALLAAAMRGPQAVTLTDSLRLRRIAAFLAAKFVAYSALGALLGMFGSAMQPSPTVRGVTQVFVGLFMLAMAIQMVRPNRVTAKLVLAPPKPLRMWIRRRAKGAGDVSEAGMLGALTVLIPCGVTQAMMVGAISTGSPLAGALTMGVFTVGTAPVFFAVAYGGSSIGRHLQGYAKRVVAVLLALLGFVALQTGMSLTGHPLPVRPIMASQTANTVVAQTHVEGASQTIEITAAGDGYVPSRIAARAGLLLRLDFRSDSSGGCTNTIVISELDVERVIAPTGTTSIQIPAQPRGSRIRWVCGMGMYSGTVEFQ